MLPLLRYICKVAYRLDRLCALSTPHMTLAPYPDKDRFAVQLLLGAHCSVLHRSQCLGLSPALENPHTRRWVGVGVVKTQEGVVKTQVGVVRTQLPPARSVCTKVPICKSSRGSAACVQLTTADSFKVGWAEFRLKSHPLHSEKYLVEEVAQVCQVHIERFRLYSSDWQQ